MQSKDKRKLVLFTFDYELFLGKKSGTVQECLIEPTNRLIDHFSAYPFKAVFFIDTIYLNRLKLLAETGEHAKRDYNNIEAQLCLLLERGHYIFPHLHAHWLDAVYDVTANEWALTNTRYYQFSNLPLELRTQLFDESVQCIRNIASKVKADYVIDSYRAGGWSIQPFESFKPNFIRHGIKHEWSVMPGRYHFSDAHHFDFRKALKNVSVYKFGDDVCVADPKGSFTEWTISALELTRLQKWIYFKVNGVLHRMGNKKFTRGATVSSTTQEEGDIFSGNGIERMTASFEGLNPYLLKLYVNAIRKAQYFHFISHPKLLTGMEFKLIERLFKMLIKEGNIETDFRKVNV